MLKQCHQHRLFSALVFAILLPTLGIVTEYSLEALERYNYRTAPIEKFYDIQGVVAHDIDLSDTDEATLEIHRSASDNFVSTRYRSLMKLGLQPVGQRHGDPPYEVTVDTVVNDVFLEEGEKVVVIKENLAELFGGADRIQEGQYYWIVQYEIHFPYNIERTTHKSSNTFTVSK